MPLKPSRFGKCKVCRNRFEKRSAWQKVCSPDCAEKIALAARIKADRRDLRLKKEALKKKSDWLKEAQAEFNAWVRERDKNEPCISCGRYHTGSYDAGHYRSVGSMPALRFHPDNVHKQCVPCNQHKGGNVVEYRLRLLQKIGPDRLAFLEGPHEAKKYTIEDAKNIKLEYRKKLRDLRANKACAAE